MTTESSGSMTILRPWPIFRAMQLPFLQKWPVGCIKCCHRAEITAAVADLAVKPLRCRHCGHRQPFSAEMIKRAPRRPNGRKARAARAVLATMKPGELDDPVADL